MRIRASMARTDLMLSALCAIALLAFAACAQGTAPGDQASPGDGLGAGNGTVIDTGGYGGSGTPPDAGVGTVNGSSVMNATNATDATAPAVPSAPAANGTLGNGTHGTGAANGTFATGAGTGSAGTGAGTGTPPAMPSGKGTVVLGIAASGTTTAADIISFPLSSAQVRGPSGDWTDLKVYEDHLAADPRDLVAIGREGRTELAARGDAESGTYDAIRLVVPSVRFKGVHGTREVSLPMNQLTIQRSVTVRPGETTAVLLTVSLNGSFAFSLPKNDYVITPAVDVRVVQDAQVGGNQTGMLVSGG